MEQQTERVDTVSMWSAAADDQALLDADCSPTKTCRNMVGISFDEFADAETDLQTAWRETLAREGKLSSDRSSVRDLVLGPHDA